METNANWTWMQNNKPILVVCLDQKKYYGTIDEEFGRR